MKRTSISRFQGLADFLKWRWRQEWTTAVTALHSSGHRSAALAPFTLREGAWQINSTRLVRQTSDGLTRWLRPKIGTVSQAGLGNINSAMQPGAFLQITTISNVIRRQPFEVILSIHSSTPHKSSPMPELQGVSKIKSMYTKTLAT